MTALLDAPVVDVPALAELWLPARYSEPLSGCETFPSHGDWLLKLVDLVWRLPDGSRITLDVWQRWLIRHVLETYPEGHERAGELRYRQVLISVGRQNGKSILGAIFGLYGLVRRAGALVIGIASSAEQARIIYSRLYKTIRDNPKLSKRFQRLTDTRGLESKDNSRYEIKAAKSAAVQGLDLSLGLVDEVHLTKPELWSDMINGTKAQRDGLVVGFTTAGDESSTLLKELYEKCDDPRERWGFFIWEAPEGDVPLLADGKTIDPELLMSYLIAANPAIACGRIDAETALSDAIGQPVPDVVRYSMNRFVKTSSGFMSLALWTKRAGVVDRSLGRPIFTIDRTPDWSFATISASWKIDDETIHTQIVAGVARPTVEKLVDLCIELNGANPLLYVADGYTLRSLVLKLKERGLRAQAASLADVTSASSLFYAKVVRGHIVHAGDAALTLQLPRAVRKNIGDAYKIVRGPANAPIDSVLATVLGVYFADITIDDSMQLFV